MKFVVVALFFAFLCSTAVLAKTVADLDRALCHADGIYLAIKNDCMSNTLERFAYVQRELGHVKYNTSELHANDELPEWASKVVDESSKSLARIMNSIQFGPHGEENYATARQYIEENCH